MGQIQAKICNESARFPVVCVCHAVVGERSRPAKRWRIICRPLIALTQHSYPHKRKRILPFTRRRYKSSKNITIFIIVDKFNVSICVFKSTCVFLCLCYICTPLLVTLFVFDASLRETSRKRMLLLSTLKNFIKLTSLAKCPNFP